MNFASRLLDLFDSRRRKWIPLVLTLILAGAVLEAFGIGLIMPFILKLWGKGWIWASIVLMVIVVVEMGVMNERRYKPLRRLVGLPYMKGNKEFPAEEPASQEEVEAHLKKLKLGELVGVGYVIPMIVLWLMVFKPF